MLDAIRPKSHSGARTGRRLVPRASGDDAFVGLRVAGLGVNGGRGQDGGRAASGGGGGDRRDPDDERSLARLGLDARAVRRARARGARLRGPHRQAPAGASGAPSGRPPRNQNLPTNHAAGNRASTAVFVQVRHCLLGGVVRWKEEGRQLVVCVRCWWGPTFELRQFTRGVVASAHDFSTSCAG